MTYYYYEAIQLILELTGDPINQIGDHLIDSLHPLGTFHRMIITTFEENLFTLR